jgi:hypothetical protein
MEGGIEDEEHSTIASISVASSHEKLLYSGW